MNLIDEMIIRYNALYKAKSIAIKKFNTYLKYKQCGCRRCDKEWELKYSEMAIQESNNIKLIDNAIIRLLEPIELNQLPL